MRNLLYSYLPARSRSSWQRTLTIIIIAEIVSEIGFGIPAPFTPFYLQELGVSSLNQVAFWVGIIAAGQSICVAVFAPIWGVVGDRFGRKLMLVRALIGGGLTAVLCGLAVSAEQFAIIRIIGGTLVGAMTASIALVAVTTPREHVGRGLGLLQTGMYIGGSFGPLAGGFIGGMLGYRAAYWISGILLIGIGALVAILVKEDFVRSTAQQQAGNPVLATLKSVAKSRGALTMIVLLAISGMGVTVSDTFLPLYVQTLVSDQSQASAVTGIIVSVTTLAYAIGASVITRLADRIGRLRVLTVCVTLAAITYLPQGMTWLVWQLLFLRIMSGFAIGGVNPVANAVIAETAPKGAQAATYGVGASLNAIGHAAGPPIGSGVVAYLGLALIFPATGLFLLISTLLTIGGMRLVRHE